MWLFTRKLFAIAAGGLFITLLSMPVARAQQLDGGRFVSLVNVLQAPPAEEEKESPVITTLDLAADGRTLAMGGDDHRVRIWDVAAGRALATLEGHADWVRVVKFSPDGATLATAGNDRKVLLWPIRGGVEVSVATDSLGGRDLSLSGPKNAKDWTSGPLEMTRHPAAIVDIAFSPDGSLLAIVGFEKDVRLYDVKRMKNIKNLAAPCCDMRHIAFSPDGRYLAAAGRSGKLRIWDLAEGGFVAGDMTSVVTRDINARDIMASRRRLRAVLFSPDSQQVYTAGEDRTVRGFQVATGEPTFAAKAQSAKVFSLAWIGPGVLAAAGSDNNIRVLDIAERKEIDRLTGHTGSVAALSVRGQTLVSAGYDATIRTWDTRRILQRDNRAELSLPQVR